MIQVPPLLRYLLLWALLIALPAHSQTDLPFFTATYSATIKGLAVTAVREYKAIDEQRAQFNFNATSWLAKVEETSEFSWHGQQIKPIAFSYVGKMVGRERRKSLSFDWPNNTIISIDKNRETRIPNEDHALDRLSFQLQLQHDLLYKHEQLAYRVADKGRIKVYRFEVIGKETVNTALGQLDTIKVKVIRDNPDKVTFLWLAENWHNLLARLEQYEDGEKEFELQLTDAIVDGKQVTAKLNEKIL